MTRKPKTSQQDPYQKLLCSGGKISALPGLWFLPQPPLPRPSLLHPFSPFMTQKTQDSQAAGKALEWRVENGLFLQLPRVGPASPLSAVPTPSHLSFHKPDF